MEYAFSGIPFVATDTDEYKEIAGLGAGNVAKRTRRSEEHTSELQSH